VSDATILPGEITEIGQASDALSAAARLARDLADETKESLAAGRIRLLAYALDHTAGVLEGLAGDLEYRRDLAAETGGAR
jgi:hypothetical protein